MNKDYSNVEPEITSFVYGDPSHDGHGWWSEFYIRTNLKRIDFETINNSMGPYFGFTLGQIVKRDPENENHIISYGHSEEYPIIFDTYMEDKLKMKDFKSLSEKGFKFSNEYTQQYYELAIKNNTPDNEYVNSGQIYCTDFEDIVKFVVNYMVRALEMKNVIFEEVQLNSVGLIGAGYGIFTS